MGIEEIQSLKLLLKDFKALTVKLIAELENNLYDNLEEILHKRQEIIIEINKINYTSDIFKELCVNMNVIQLEHKATMLMNDKKNILKKELSQVEGSKTANKNYNKRFSVDSLYFNKKI